ncbi:hypothetical protein [Pseudomonas syringae]|uniref:hypothetical protein n=1 Tax=Pseudomonas syringae TaxID=317 RepID=UPI001F26FB96|nr:hypothetical protein [Pseudomonas syringae]MCF5371331.1 hypothetical protein [Pseudomonas syringae]MCF5382072.1 hypothetical protein [Pseudomonas syringae]MCF5419344.1 hypothetical protein [Pseudomonas syringae]MCF5454474.1 hypothetical protein [Pseudomonas syringae]MCF5458400.1 hypothetical protein [Pseudomonas syringae]
MIKLDTQYLYIELPEAVIHDLLADVVTRYESFFTFAEPTYPEGQPELLFKVLSAGYDLSICSSSLGVPVIDLRALRVMARTKTNPQWADVIVGRILAATFASTINCS